MKSIAVLLLLAGTAWCADTPAVVHWTPAAMKEWRARLAPKLDAQHVASARVADFGKYFFLAALRTATGQAELHEKDADIMMIQSGEATLVTGGAMVNPKTTQPHEERASAIRGGHEIHIAPGDVVSIPPGTPHQMKLQPGTEILYLTIKVIE